jgi:hypothetical protein
MIGVPAYNPISRVNVYSASTQLESITGYNSVMNFLVNNMYDVAGKYGAGFGYFNDTGVPSLEELDGRTMVLNETGSFSAPLMTILSNCDKYIPLFATPAIRIELIVENIANMFRSEVVPTNFVLSNVELCYRSISMPSLENIIRASGKTLIKTQSFLNSSAYLNSASSGQISLIYNSRLASLKSAYVLFNNTVAGSNLWGDSVDISKSNGQFQLQISGKNFPQTSYNSATNKQGIYQALRGAVGVVFDKNNMSSINAVEFNKIDGDTCTLTTPGKFYLGVSTEVISGNDYLLSGIATSNSPISLNMSLGTATTNAYNVALLLNYDAILEIDFVAGQANLRM